MYMKESFRLHKLLKRFLEKSGYSKSPSNNDGKLTYKLLLI